MRIVIEEIRDKDREDTGDEFHSDDEEEEQSVIPNYAPVEELCKSRETGAYEREQLHKQAVARAAEAGRFNDKELKVVMS